MSLFFSFHSFHFGKEETKNNINKTINGKRLEWKEKWKEAKKRWKQNSPSTFQIG